MEKILTIAQVIAPIFGAIFMGALARRKKLMSPEEVKGLQQFVMQFGLPCVVFNSLLTANMGMESLTSMALVLPVMVASTFWAFGARRKGLPYRNLPMLFSAQETGMLGIPLFMILFGAAESYRMGVLDLTQAITAYPVIAILSSNTGENPSPVQIVKKVVTSPLLIVSALGLALNLTGIGDWLAAIGLRDVITETTGFLGQPISAMMIFSVGYNFSLDKGSRKTVFQISGIHLAMFTLFGLVIQGILFLIPGIDAMTRWVLLLYFALPTSYLGPVMGRTQEEGTMASGVCSLLTLFAIAVFCVMVAVTA